MSDRPGNPAHEFREVIPVSEAGTLFVDLDVGSIRVESHAEPVVRIEASSVPQGLVRFLTERQGPDVYLDGDFDFSPAALCRGIRVKVRVRVPEGYSVDVHTRGGRIRLEGIGGRAAAETAGGEITACGVAGPLLLRTAGGRIRVEDAPGDVRARTLGGSIEVRRVAGDLDLKAGGGAIRAHSVEGRLVATTGAGRVSARFSGPPAGELRTAAGAIDVRIPRGAGADLDARTTAGRIDLDPGIAFDGARGPSRLVGRIGGGGAALVLRAAVGAIRLDQGSPAAPQDPERARPQSPPACRIVHTPIIRKPTPATHESTRGLMY